MFKKNVCHYDTEAKLRQPTKLPSRSVHYFFRLPLLTAIRTMPKSILQDPLLLSQLKWCEIEDLLCLKVFGDQNVKLVFSPAQRKHPAHRSPHVFDYRNPLNVVAKWFSGCDLTQKAEIILCREAPPGLFTCKRACAAFVIVGTLVLAAAILHFPYTPARACVRSRAAFQIVRFERQRWIFYDDSLDDWRKTRA